MGRGRIEGEAGGQTAKGEPTRSFLGLTGLTLLLPFTAILVPSPGWSRDGIGCAALPGLLLEAREPAPDRDERRERRRSAGGRRVVFQTDLALDPADGNGLTDVYLADRDSGRTVWVSRGGDAPSLGPNLTADGRHVVFWSYADNLVAADANGLADVFLARVGADGLEALVLVSTDRFGPAVPAGIPGATPMGGDGHSTEPSVSDDGRWVSFCSLATNLVPLDANQHTADVFLAGLTDTPEGPRVSSMLLVSTDCQTPWTGDGANGPSRRPLLERDASRVRFESCAGDLVLDDLNGIGRDRFHARLGLDPGAPRVLRIALLTPPGERQGALGAGFGIPRRSSRLAAHGYGR